MQHYPTFDRTEYNCLNPDLSAVDYWVKLNAVMDKMEEAEAERNALLTHDVTRREQVKKAILSGLPTPKDRVATLRQLVEEAMRLSVRPGVSTGQASQNLINTRYYFSDFDAEDFEEVWVEAFGNEDVSKKLSSIEGRMGGLTKQLQTVRNSLAQCFVDGTYPRRWRNHVLTEDATPEERNLYGSMIVTNFIGDWSQRAKLFSVPVTVYWVSIRSLDSSRSGTWMAAYEKLGLQNKPKSPYYAAIESDGRRIEKQREEQRQRELEATAS